MVKKEAKDNIESLFIQVAAFEMLVESFNKGETISMLTEDNKRVDE